MSRTRQLIGVLALVPVLALPACGSRPAETAGGAPTREVVTAHGAVRVPTEPRRIVVLSGGMTGSLYALGVPVLASDTRVLGVPTDSAGFPPAWSAEARRQGTEALPNGEDLNLEAVAATHPDLIIGGGQGLTGFQAERNYDKLTRIAPTVLVPTTVDTWQEELRLLADAVGRADLVPAMLRAYDEKVAAVRASITVPPGPVVVLLSFAGEQPYLAPPDASLPNLLRQLGFTPDDVLVKAGNPRLIGTGDWFRISPELLSHSPDAPTAFFIQVTGAPFERYAANPLYARLPAFRLAQVHQLPTLSYRPDHAAVMQTLDLIAGQFRGIP